MTDMNDLHESPTADDRSFVFAVTRRILANEDAANDATQDALLVAHRFRDRFRQASSYRTWLYRIAVNAALGSLRRGRRMREELCAEPPEAIDPAASPEAEVATRELVAEVLAELTRLGPTYRDALALRALDWGEREIAELLGISLANTKVRVHRARRHLREHLMPRARSARPALRGNRADSTATRRAS